MEFSPYSLQFNPNFLKGFLKSEIVFIGQLGVGKHSILSSVNQKSQNEPQIFLKYSSYDNLSVPWLVNLLICDHIVSLSIRVFDGEFSFNIIIIVNLLSIRFR